MSVCVIVVATVVVVASTDGVDFVVFTDVVAGCYDVTGVDVADDSVLMQVLCLLMLLLLLLLLLLLCRSHFCYDVADGVVRTCCCFN